MVQFGQGDNSVSVLGQADGDGQVSWLGLLVLDYGPNNCVTGLG